MKGIDARAVALAFRTLAGCTPAGPGATGGGVELQTRITGACDAGSAVRGINADGTLVCLPIVTGSGSITTIKTADGSGLIGGVTEGAATLSLMSCGDQQVLKTNGSSWSCADDAATTLSAAATGGLQLTGTALSLASCPPGQWLQSQGTGWACAAANFILNGTAVQDAGFNISGNAIIGSPFGNRGSLQVGANTSAPQARLTVAPLPALIVRGTVSGVVNGNVLSGVGTGFNEIHEGIDLIEVNGVRRRVILVDSDVTLAVDQPWPSTFSGQTLSVLKPAFLVDGTAESFAVDTSGSLYRTCPQSPFRTSRIRNTSRCLGGGGLGSYDAAVLTCGRAGGHVCNEEDLMLACDSNNAGFETVPGFGFPGAGSVPAGTWIGNASGSDDFYKVTNGSGAGCTNIDGPAVTRATNNSYLCCFDNGR